MHFLDLIKERRHALNLTQAEVALQIGCAHGTYRRLESGHLIPSREFALRIAQVLKIPQGITASYLAELAAQWRKRVRPIQSSSANTESSVLPIPRTRLVGRTSEIKQLVSWLRSPQYRLIQVSGTPGVGKTAIASEVIEKVRKDFSDGVLVVLLAHYPMLTMNEIASLFITQFERLFSTIEQPVDALTEHLRDRHMLLVIDNCEHMPEVGLFVRYILKNTRHIKILTTSRSPLTLDQDTPEEQVLCLAPLDLPKMRVKWESLYREAPGALALLLNLIHANDIKLSRSYLNIRALVDICNLLDGIPMALEVAAIRMHTFPPPVLYDLFKKHLIEATTPNTGTSAPQGHAESLFRLIDWSVALVSPNAQKLFGICSVFEGEFSLEALSAVADSMNISTISASLYELITANLLKIRSESEIVTDSTPLYSLYFVIREVAKQQLNDTEQAISFIQKHANYYLNLIENHNKHFTNVRINLEWHRFVSQHNPNFKKALESFVQAHQFDCVLRLWIGLTAYWYHSDDRKSSIQKLFNVLAQAEKSLSVPLSLIVQARIVYSDWCLDNSDFEDQEAFTLKTYDLAHNLAETLLLAKSLLKIIHLYMIIGDFKRASTFSAEAEYYAEKSENEDIKIKLYNNLCLLALNSGNTSQYDYYSKRRLKLNFDQADAIFLFYQGLFHYLKSEFDHALANFTKALQQFTKLKKNDNVKNTLCYMAAIYRLMGNYADTIQVCNKILEDSVHFNDRRIITRTHIELSLAYCNQGDLLKAKRFAKLALSKALQLKIPASEQLALLCFAFLAISEEKYDLCARIINTVRHVSLGYNPVQLYLVHLDHFIGQNEQVKHALQPLLQQHTAQDIQKLAMECL